MILVTISGTPGPGARVGEDAAGAIFNVWVATFHAGEAQRHAREVIGDMGWVIRSIDSAEPIGRPFFWRRIPRRAYRSAERHGLYVASYLYEREDDA